MYFIFLYMFCVLSSSSSDWVSEWMTPVQGQFDNPVLRTSNGAEINLFSDDVLRMVPVTQNSYESSTKNDLVYRSPGSDLSTTHIKNKLEETLQNAKVVADILKAQIAVLTSRENTLKEAITNGRAGVTVLTVSTIGQPPRSYLIRDNHWTLCNGVIQLPVPSQPSLFNSILNGPRCMGQEVTTKQDPCVFNSIIKYETVPTQRRPEYSEDDYLCLRTTFNNTLEQYMSVSKQLINVTCKNGIVKTLAENTIDCGVRMVSEYTFYPHRSSTAAQLPLEYCTERDGSCDLTVAWHVSNTTIENFEFLKNELNFKKYFIKSTVSGLYQ